MENLDHSNNKNVSLSLIAEYGGSDSDSDDTETRSNDNTTDSDAADLTEMVLKNNIINACAHGPLSRPSGRDGADVSRHMIIDSAESGVVEYEVTEYRDADSDSDSESTSASSDSDVDSVKDIEEVSSGDELEGQSKTGKPETPKVIGEMGLDDLPPIEDLAISLPAQETTKIGTIASIVDRLVIVRALPETPAVDLDSVLFLDNGAKALGRVFDVFGPVTEPHYCVRFNSAEHVRERGAAAGADVFIAPRTQHTNYVFLAELMKIKGSDASWLHDVEPPPHQIEYSDDEEERRANRARREQRRADRTEESEDGETSKNTRKVPERRNQRPSESSSRFGSGPSRGRNPFAAGSRRNNNPNAFPRSGRPWPNNMGLRTPPPHPNSDQGAHGPFSAPPNFNGPPMFPPPFNPSTPPPFMGNMFQFGSNRMSGSPMPPPMTPPFRHNVPVFGASYCSVAGPHPQWVNNGPPPPPGT
uniref:H/ACA ribonucleoprotein complex non-core subunit NAF1 n=1 Tax=Heliothis virescens TaxID=7102 RepID=A0A2A4JYQ3_HELVI